MCINQHTLSFAKSQQHTFAKKILSSGGILLVHDKEKRGKKKHVEIILYNRGHFIFFYSSVFEFLNKF